MASVNKRKWTHKGAAKEAWVVRYTDQGGKRRMKTFDLKKEADKYRTRVEGEVEAGLHVAARETMTVKDLCAEFLRWNETRQENGMIGRGRLDNLRMTIKTHVVPNLGGRKVADLTPVMVEDWINRTRSKVSNRTGGTLSPTMIRHLLSLMKLLENFAVKRGALKRRFMAEARRELGSIRSEPIRTFTVKELQQLLAGIDRGARGRNERNISLLRCYVHIAAFCGLRLGEINALKPENIDLDRRTIRVRHNLTSYGELKGPKTRAGVRDVPMPNSIRDMLTDWMAHHHMRNGLGVVFTTSTGEPLYRVDFNMRWRRLLASSGLIEGRSLHFHALRHFAASFMIAHGLPLPDVARLLGHEHFDMTLQVYAHPVREVDQYHDAMERMTRAVAGASSAPEAAARPGEPAISGVALVSA